MKAGDPAKFDYGETVRIVNYGHLMWGKASMIPENHPHFIKKVNDLVFIDVIPQLVGKTAKVIGMKFHYLDGSHQTGYWQYSLDIKDKISWYYEDQLEKV